MKFGGHFKVLGVVALILGGILAWLFLKDTKVGVALGGVIAVIGALLFNRDRRSDLGGDQGISSRVDRDKQSAENANKELGDSLGRLRDEVRSLDDLSEKSVSVSQRLAELLRKAEKKD